MIYAPLWELLAPHFDIFLHDTQGHGNSEHGGRFVGWERSAALAMEVWRKFSEAFLWSGEMPLQIGMGHSFGGVLTTAMQAQSPQFFDRLLLLDPIVMPPLMLNFLRVLGAFGLYRLNPHAKRAARRRPHWPSPDAALEALANRGMHKGWTPAAMEAFVTYGLEENAQGEWQLKCLPSREAEVFSSYLPGLWKAIPTLHVPTDVIVGKETYPFVLESMQHWRKVNPRTNILEVEGGHCFMQQHPRRTAQVICELLLR